MSKLIWHSNAPWSPTGYGQQTGLFLPHLKDHYETACSAFYGLEGSPITWQGIPVFPGMSPEMGNAFLPGHAKRFFDGDLRGGLVVTLMDVWVLDPERMATMNVASWVPVDHEPAPPKVVSFFLESGAVPVAMSEFGRAMLGRLDPLYVPHAVDTELYKPVPRAVARAEAGCPEGAFLVGMVAANKGRPSRKSFSQAFQAFKRLSEKHENAYLYLHTMVNEQYGGGENIEAILRALDVPKDKILIPDQYRIMFDPYSHESMAKIYSTFDVLLNPAMGEGFGVPVLRLRRAASPRS